MRHDYPFAVGHVFLLPRRFFPCAFICCCWKPGKAKKRGNAKTKKWKEKNVFAAETKKNAEVAKLNKELELKKGFVDGIFFVEFRDSSIICKVNLRLRPEGNELQGMFHKILTVNFWIRSEFFKFCHNQSLSRFDIKKLLYLPVCLLVGLFTSKSVFCVLAFLWIFAYWNRLCSGTKLAKLHQTRNTTET